ncbi:MAG TPA: DUF3574 domain-containing protein [Gemmatimonadales bacterium]|nr:DUF3574 domain-containing protein [Gemmatimonadales bacterium]
MYVHRLTVTAALLLASACAPSVRGTSSSPVLIERLYFGRNAGDSLVVTDSAWAAFLVEVVTPRFPDGFTAWPAEGQWRGANGVLEREPSFVVELVHPVGGGFDRALTEVVAEYKRRFRQESVLRVRASARASF